MTREWEKAKNTCLDLKLLCNECIYQTSNCYCGFVYKFGLFPCEWTKNNHPKNKKVKERMKILRGMLKK